MVKSKFPGKPSKLTQRTLVSAYSIVVPSCDTSAITENVRYGLSVFDGIFGSDEQKANFNGFTKSAIVASQEKMDKFSADVASKFSSCGLSYPCLPKKSLRIALTPIEFSKSETTPRKGKSDSEGASLRRLKERNKCGKIWLLAKKGTNRYLPKIQMRHNFKTLNKSSLIRFKHKPLSSNYLTDKYCRKFTLPSRSLHSSRVIKPNKRFIDAEKSCESKLTVGRVEPFESSMRVSSSKVIIREARLNITTEPAVAGPFSVKRNVPPDKEKFRSGLITCGICGAIRYYKYILQAKKFGVFSCEPCRRFILKMIKQSKHFNGEFLECKGENGPGKCVMPIDVANKKDSADDLAKTARCQACWLSLCLQRYIMPSTLRKSLIKLIPEDLKVFLSNALSVDLRTHLHLKSDTKSMLGEEPNEKLNDRLAANRFIKSVRSSIRTLERHDTSNAPVKSKVLRIKKNLSSQRLCSKNESDWENSGKDNGIEKSHYLPRGPRIKHVCRSASSVLRTSLVTLNDEETDDFVCNSSESESGRRLRKNKNGDSKIERQCQLNKVRQCDDSAAVTVVENQNDAEFTTQHYGARSLQDFSKDSSDESDENDDKLISTDFWEAYDPDEVFKTGFPLICTEPINVRALCFLCGSAGVEKLLYCTSCCEPYHWYCAEGPSVFREDVELEKYRVNWICRKCKVCSTCGEGSDSRVLTSCKRCRNSYHAECLNSKALNKRLFKSDRPWVCPSCLKCKSCNATSVFTHVGNIPLCSECFKLRQKGNYCPLCQGCYQDEDYNVQMMECGICKCWIHAKCEGISHEKYQVLSFLPDTIEFVCRLCCSNPPAQWWLAVEDELKSGYLGILECLCKNKKICDLLKESPPKENACNCSKNETISKMPTDDTAAAALEPGIADTSGNAAAKPPSSVVDKYEGESQSADKSPCLTERRRRRLHCRGSYDNDDEDEDEDENDENESPVDTDCGSKSPTTMPESETEPCSTCRCSSKKRSDMSGRLLAIKANVRTDQYASLGSFHRDLESVLLRIEEEFDLVGVYREILKQFFPWFDPCDEKSNNVYGGGSGETPIRDDNGAAPNDMHTASTAVGDCADDEDDYETLRKLVAADEYDYESVRMLDVRKCNLCKGMGEAIPSEGGRLIYCGRNEWVHSNCALWSSEVFEEIDGSLQNVHSAVSRGRQIRCSVCEKKGASVGCCFKNCTLTYHFLCAKRARCVFLQNKTIYCHSHQLRETTTAMVVTAGKTSTTRSLLVDEKDFDILRPVYVEMDRKKKKMECHTDVKLRIGALHVENLGKIDPHLSDNPRYIMPIYFRCTRLFWSTLKPWKIVQYHVQIKVSYSYQRPGDEEANYTVDHSMTGDGYANEEDDDTVIRQVIDELTSKACDNGDCGESTPNADLLSPELQEAIYQDLPKDFLDDGSLHDMWNSYENVSSSSTTTTKTTVTVVDRRAAEKETKRTVVEHEPKKGKTETSRSSEEVTPEKRNHGSNGFKCLRDKNDFTDGRLAKQSHGNALDSLYSQLRAKRKRKMNFENSTVLATSAKKRARHNGYISAAKLSDVVVDYYASFENIVQLDGMVDVYSDEEPVKCSQCYRTYRTTLSFQRHLDTCNLDFGDYMISSCESDSVSSEEEKFPSADPKMELFDDDVTATPTTVTAAPGVGPPTSQMSDASFATKYSSAFVIEDKAAPATVGLPYVSNVCTEAQLNGTVYPYATAYENSPLTGEGLQNSVTLQSLLQNMKRQTVAPSLTTVPAFAESQMKFNIVNGDGKISCPEYAVQQYALSDVSQTPSFAIQNVATPTYVIQQYAKPEVVPTFVTIDNGVATAVNAAGDHRLQSEALLTTTGPQLQLQPMTSINFQPVLPTIVGTMVQPNVIEAPTTYIVNAPTQAAAATTAAELFAPQNIIIPGGQPVLLGVETMVSNTVMSASHQYVAAAGNLGSSTLYSTTTTQFFQAAKQLPQPQPNYSSGYIVLNNGGAAWQPVQQPLQQSVTAVQPVKQALQEQFKPSIATIVSDGDKYMYVKIDNSTPSRAKSATSIIMKPVPKPNAPGKKSIKVMKVKNNRPVAIQTVDNVIPLSGGQSEPTGVARQPVNKTTGGSPATAKSKSLQIKIVDETVMCHNRNSRSVSATAIGVSAARDVTKDANQSQTLDVPVTQCDQHPAKANNFSVANTARHQQVSQSNRKPNVVETDTFKVNGKDAAVAAEAPAQKKLVPAIAPKNAGATVTGQSPVASSVHQQEYIVIDLTGPAVPSQVKGRGCVDRPANSSSTVTAAPALSAPVMKSTNDAASAVSRGTRCENVCGKKTTAGDGEGSLTKTYGGATTALRSMPLIDFDPPAKTASVSETDKIFDELLRQHKLSLESASSAADSSKNPIKVACPVTPSVTSNDEHPLSVSVIDIAENQPRISSAVNSTRFSNELLPATTIQPPSMPSLQHPPPTSDGQSAPPPKLLTPKEPSSLCKSGATPLLGKSKYKPNVTARKPTTLTKEPVAAAARKPEDAEPATKTNAGRKKKTPEKEKEKENVTAAAAMAGQLLPELENKSWKTASISYEVNAEDGFSYKTNDLLDLWNKILESVQQSRAKYKLPLLPKNVLVNSDSVYGLLGFENNASRYLLEQLPDAWKCIFYKPVFHKSPLYDGKTSPTENATGCARTEPFTSSHKYDMFGWLASRHRKPPKFMLISDSDIVNGNRRITSLNLPMAMRFRHLKETAKETVGVFRSDIHGRGLFCLRDIDAGEMVIEYAGEVIRSTLTDKREKFYTSKGIGCYMFRIDDKYVVDATMCGNAARFINHSCDPNCYSRIVDILGKKHILIFALRRIPKGEELTYDYKFPLEDDKIHCHCLSRKCRKYLN